MAEERREATELGGRAGSRPLAETSVGDELVWVLVESAPDALVVVDDRGAIQLVNGRTEELFGYDRSELLGRPVEDLMPERSQGAHLAHRTRYRARPTPRVMGAGQVLQGRRRDGTEFPVEISLSPAAAGDGMWTMAAVRDVSDRLAAERHSRAIRYAIHTALDGLFILDADSLRFSYVNEAGCRMYGYSVDELITMGPLDLTPDPVEDDVGEACRALMAGDLDQVRAQVTSRRRDGTEFPTEVLVNYPAADPDIPERSFVAVVRDMTEWVRMERAMAANQARSEVSDERERLAQDLHDTVIGDLFGIALGLQSVAGRIGDQSLSDRVQDAVESIDDVITRIRHTIHRVKNRSTTNEDLAGQILAIAADVGDRLGHQPVVTMAGPLNLLPHEVIEHLLPTIHEALINVAKHARAARSEIHLDVEPDQLVLRVSDNGIGLPASGPPSSGMGHANMHTRAEGLGGQCTIDSTPRAGVTVTWAVPLTGRPSEREGLP